MPSIPADDSNMMLLKIAVVANMATGLAFENGPSHTSFKTDLNDDGPGLQNHVRSELYILYYTITM